MGDIFDEMAGSSGPDVFDHLAGNLPAQEEPSILEKIMGAAFSTPKAVATMVSDIPTGLSNLAHLPLDLIGTGVDAEEIARSKLFGSTFTPAGITDYPRTERTLRGIGNIASTIVGTPLGPLGMAATNEAYNKVNQLTGSDAPTSGQESFDNVLRNTIQGGILGGVGKAAGAGLGKLSEITEPISKEMEMVQSLGAPTIGQIKKANSVKATIDGLSPLERAVQGTIDRGVFTGDASPEAIALRNSNALSGLAEQVHGEGGLLSAADEALTNKTAPIPKESLGWWKSLDDYVNQRNAMNAEGSAPSPLSFPRAEKVAAADLTGEFPFQAAELQKQLTDQKNIIGSLWDGTLSGLSKIKSKLGKDAFSGTGAARSKVLDQAIFQDLKNTIEQRANEAVPGLGDQIGKLNDMQSEHYALNPWIEKAQLKAEQQGYKPSPNFSAIERLKNTTGGVMGPIIAGAMLKGTTGALEGAAVGLGAKFLASPAGKSTVRGVGRGTSAVAGSLADVVNAVAPAVPGATIAANNNPVTQSTLDDLMSSTLSKGKKVDAIQAIQEIKADPYLHAAALTESEMDPNRIPIDPKTGQAASTAKGIFQFLDGTAKLVGLKDAKDIPQSLEAMKKLTDSNAQILKTRDPEVLYAAHVLGATLLRKVQNHQNLSTDDQALVDNFFAKSLPRFQEKYKYVTSLA